MMMDWAVDTTDLWMTDEFVGERRWDRFLMHRHDCRLHSWIRNLAIFRKIRDCRQPHLSPAQFYNISSPHFTSRPPLPRPTQFYRRLIWIRSAWRWPACDYDVRRISREKYDDIDIVDSRSWPAVMTGARIAWSGHCGQLSIVSRRRGQLRY